MITCLDSAIIREVNEDTPMTQSVNLDSADNYEFNVISQFHEEC
jgi:hypothetical protein